MPWPDFEDMAPNGDFLPDAVAFGRWLLEALAQRLCEKSSCRRSVQPYGYEQLY